MAGKLLGVKKSTSFQLFYRFFLNNLFLILLSLLSLLNICLLSQQTFANSSKQITIPQSGEDMSFVPNMISSSRVILHGPRDSKKIALTFDADMTAYMKQQVLLHNYPESINRQIIQILLHTQTPATIFMTGMWAEMYPEEAKTLAVNSLFEIASHSYSHQSFARSCFGLGILPQDQQIYEIGHTEGVLEQITGVKVQYFRFPGGCYDLYAVNMVNQAGETVVHWDVAGEDGFNTDTKLIEENILSQTKNGSIIVLHFNGPPTAPMTADALPIIISSLKQKGYQFVKVNELLNMPSEERL